MSPHSAWTRVAFLTLNPRGKSKVIMRLAPGLGTSALVEEAGDP